MSQTPKGEILHRVKLLTGGKEIVVCGLPIKDTVVVADNRSVTCPKCLELENSS